MSAKLLKEKLKAGETVYGTMFAHALDPAIVNWLPRGGTGLCHRHAGTTQRTTWAEFLPVRHALEAKGIACIARTHGRDTADIAKVCDTYDGVVVPYVEDFEEAKRLAAAAVYRPLKGKVLGTRPGDRTMAQRQDSGIHRTEECRYSFHPNDRIRSGRAEP